MNTKLLLTILSIFIFSPLAAIACPVNKDPNSLEYTRRDNNRCEGLKDRNASNIIDLASFSTGLTNLNNNYPDTLNISVPSKDSPTIEVESNSKNYRLDDLAFTTNVHGFAFLLNTHILKAVDVPRSSLHARAYIIQDSHRIFFPVIIGKATGEYEFIFTSGDQKTSLPTFEIRQNGRRIFGKADKIPGNNHQLIWNYGNTPPGTYELYIEDNHRKKYTYYFEHNPKLF